MVNYIFFNYYSLIEKKDDINSFLDTFYENFAHVFIKTIIKPLLKFVQKRKIF